MKINFKSREKVISALVVGQKKYSARTLDADVLYEAVRQSEARLSGVLPKNCWKGLSLSITASPQKIPASYNGIPMATYAVVTRYPSGWFLTKLSRERAREGGRDVVILGLEERSHEMAMFLSRTIGTFELEGYFD